MRVAFFTSTRRACGIADYSRHLLEPMRRLSDVEVIAAEDLSSPAHYGELGRRMNDADVAQIQYEHGFFLTDDTPAENFDAFMQAIRVPKVVTFHCPPLEHPLWDRHLADKSNVFLVHSRRHQRYLRARGARAVIEATPHPAPPRTNGGVTAQEIQSRYGLDGRVVLTIFGFTKPHKGYDLALDALQLLPPQTTLLIAGGPQNERDEQALSALQRRAAALGLGSRLLVTGYVAEEEVGAVFRASDVVLAPFTSMTASGSLATALAWERPVIASRLEQNVELHDELGCLRLFEAGQAEDLARQIELVLSDANLRRSLIEGAHRFHQSCTFEALAQQMCSLYARAIAERTAVR